MNGGRPAAPGAGHPPPAPGEQLAGLGFALLLVGPDLIIAEGNPAAESLLGRSNARLAGMSLLDLVEIGAERLLGQLRSGETFLNARGLNLRLGQRQARIDLTASPLSTHPGWQVITLHEQGQDEHLADEERRSVLRGPAILAHEIKNPLAAIRGAAQLLGRKANEEQRGWTQMIEAEVGRIAQLIDRMQRLGREQAEPVAAFNLHAAVHTALDTIRAARAGEADWRAEFDPSLPQVLASQGALVQVLLNLLANALDACAGQAEPRIVIRTRFASGVRMNVPRLGRPLRLPIEIIVSDNGPGIDPAMRDHVFEPFVSSKPRGQGLGLALVQKLVGDMNGRVSHERDEAGGWTHFRIHLPMAG